MRRAGALLLGLVGVGAAVAMASSRDAEATSPRGLRPDALTQAPTPGAPVPSAALPPGETPPLSATAPREEGHPPPPAPATHDEGAGCGRSFHTPIEGRLARRGAYRTGKPHAFMYCPSWSAFGPARGHRFHGGVDISAPTGSPVRAATTGTLTYAHDPGGYGLYARVQFPHPKRTRAGTCEPGGEVEIIYAHLQEGSQKGPKTPRQVHAGDVIGHVGCTGNARGMCSPSPESHVHVTVQRVDGDRRRLEPVSFLGWSVGDAERGSEWSACGAR